LPESETNASLLFFRDVRNRSYLHVEYERLLKVQGFGAHRRTHTYIMRAARFSLWTVR